VAVVDLDDARAVANAGVMLPALFARRLGLQELVEECVDLGDRPGAANPGRKVMTMCLAMVLGADCIDDCDLLRSGQTGAVLGHGIAAPSTMGTCLRAFTVGHVRQLDRVLGLALQRAWAAGAGPGDGRLVADVDSFVGEVHGYKKQGAAYGYTRKLGYHPLLATRADSGEVLHIRLRKGSANTSRGILRFCDELIARIDRAGASGPKLLRADSGFWAKKTFARLHRAGWQFSIGIRHAAPRPRRRGSDRRGRADHLGGLPQGVDRADRRDTARRLSDDRPPGSACSPSRPSCCPPGSTTHWRPTAPTASQRSKPSIANTPSSSSRFEPPNENA
jgi:hypothetical protein